MQDPFELGAMIEEANTKLGPPSGDTPPPETSLPPSEETATADTSVNSQVTETGDTSAAPAQAGEEAPTQEQQTSVADQDEDPRQSPNVQRVRTWGEVLRGTSGRSTGPWLTRWKTSAASSW